MLLATLLQQAKDANKDYPIGYVDTTCPICNNDTCQTGEYVDYGIKVTPDHCWVCGYSEGNGMAQYPDTTEYVLNCWRLQLCPYPDMLGMYE